MKLVRSLRTRLADTWPALAFYGVLLALFGGLLWLELGGLTPGYSASEVGAQTASSTLKQIFHHPVDAPFLLVVHGLGRLFGQHIVLVRYTAAAFGLLTLTLFYWLVRYWHGQRAAALGTVLFGTSAWFLHTARLGTPDVLYFLLLALAACGVWLKHRTSALAVLACFIVAAALMYVPGMVWFVALFVVWQWKAVDRAFKRQLWMVSLGALVLLATLAPLGLAIYHDHQLAKVIIGLPEQGWPQPLPVLRALAEVPLNILVRGPANPEHWLGRLALLDAFSLAMLGLGGYVYFKHLRLDRTRLVAGALVVGAVLIAFGVVSLSVIVPFVYVLVAAGGGFLLDRWYVVFPRNVIAQSVGVGLITIAVLAAGWYGLRQYFVAWANAPATQSVFTIRPATPSGTMKR